MIDYKKLLLENADEGYKKFQGKLLPGTEDMLGVRLPVIRGIAAQILRDNPIGFLGRNGWDSWESYEEKLLHGIVIGGLKLPFDQVAFYVAEFVPHIDNWGVCDSFCSSLKITKKHQDDMLELIRESATRDQEYSQRFAAVMLLNYYMDSFYVDTALDLLESMKHEGYYTKMAVAWAISIGYIKEKEKTEEFLLNKPLDPWIRKKALQKIRESRQVDRKDIERITERLAEDLLKDKMKPTEKEQQHDERA